MLQQLGKALLFILLAAELNETPSLRSLCTKPTLPSAVPGARPRACCPSPAGRSRSDPGPVQTSSEARSQFLASGEQSSSQPQCVEEEAFRTAGQSQGPS